MIALRQHSEGLGADEKGSGSGVSEARATAAAVADDEEEGGLSTVRPATSGEVIRKPQAYLCQALTINLGSICAGAWQPEWGGGAVGAGLALPRMSVFTRRMW